MTKSKKNLIEPLNDDKLACVSSAVNSQEEEIAQQVIAGKWGTSEEDIKKNLTSAGYNYYQIMIIVNSISGYKLRPLQTFVVS